MTIERQDGPRNRSSIVTVGGEVDLYSATDFFKALQTEMDNGSQRLLIDCKSLEYLDSSGVGVLIRTMQKARTLSCSVALAGLQGTPLKVLQLSNISSLFAIFPSRNDATKFWD